MTDIPDIRSALIEGCYAYDFVRDIRGKIDYEEANPRLRELERLLTEPECSTALYVLIIIGTRMMLDARAKQTGDERPTAEEIAQLAGSLGEGSGLNSLAFFPPEKPRQ